MRTELDSDFRLPHPPVAWSKFRKGRQGQWVLGLADDRGSCLIRVTVLGINVMCQNLEDSRKWQQSHQSYSSSGKRNSGTDVASLGALEPCERAHGLEACPWGRLFPALTDPALTFSPPFPSQIGLPPGEHPGPGWL